jgi:hypothetical protein
MDGRPHAYRNRRDPPRCPRFCEIFRLTFWRESTSRLTVDDCLSESSFLNGWMIAGGLPSGSTGEALEIATRQRALIDSYRPRFCPATTYTCGEANRVPRQRRFPRLPTCTRIKAETASTELSRRTASCTSIVIARSFGQSLQQRPPRPSTHSNCWNASPQNRLYRPVGSAEYFGVSLLSPSTQCLIMKSPLWPKDALSRLQ